MTVTAEDSVHNACEKCGISFCEACDIAGSPLPWRKRQRLFWDPKMRKERQYSLEHVWTFVMYQSQVNMSTYGLDVALKYDLSRHLDGQPLQFMLKDRSVFSPEDIFSFPRLCRTVHL